MLEKIVQTIKKYNLIENGDKIVIGVSGGPDSICLLHNLNELKNKNEINFEIIVAHINHMIRPEADDETRICSRFLQKTWNRMLCGKNKCNRKVKPRKNWHRRSR